MKNWCFNWRMSCIFATINITLVACVPTIPDPDALEKAAFEARTMLQDYQAAVREGGLLAEFEFLDSSKDFFWIPPGATAAKDFATVKAEITANAKGLDSISCEWTSLEIHPLTVQIMTYAGKMTAFSISEAGDTSSAKLIESGTLVRRANGWKLLSGQTSVVAE